MKKILHTEFQKRVAAVAVASTLCMAPVLAEAASLGKITVMSAMGQPLRAEIEVSAARDELAGMVARLSAQGAGQAGGDYSPALADLRFALDKRPNGTSIVRVSSVKRSTSPS